jgi:glycosyltransferase involved in cell wall biosynthesis
MASLSGLVTRLRKALTRHKRYPVLYNIYGADESRVGKRALLVYVVKAFLATADDTPSEGHQNLRRARALATVLSEFGYIVDVADTRDQGFEVDRSYDLVLKDRVRLNHFEPAPGGTKRLLLATTMNHVAHNWNLRARHQRLYQRRGRQIQIRRLYNEKLTYASEVDAIVGIGNESTLGTWRQSSPARIHMVDNFGLSDTRFVFETKDFGAARKRFLYFASGSQVQKGLDLLLEIFPHLPALDLYVCSQFGKETDFCECYHKELFETPNVHPVGWIKVNGPEFYELAGKCAYVISASCSEGQSGSVVQCMYAGLIPVVTRETGIDTEDFGITFGDDSLEEIERVIVRLAGLPETWHREHSLKTRQVAEEKYSEAAFVARWREILAEVLRA